MQVPVLQAGAGLRGRRSARGSGAAQQAAAGRGSQGPLQRGARHGPLAARAEVPVGVDVLPGPAGQERIAAHLEPGDVAGFQVGDARDRLPGPFRLVVRGPCRTSRESTGMKAGTAACCSASTTSMAVTSGAAVSIASSTANFRVTDDDGQPWQLPSSLSRTTPSVG